MEAGPAEETDTVILMMLVICKTGPGMAPAPWLQANSRQAAGTLIRGQMKGPHALFVYMPCIRKHTPKNRNKCKTRKAYR